MIEFENVSKVYDNGTRAINDLNLVINKGEFVFIVGSSGAGKSTFLKMIMKEEDPSSGEIIIAGRRLSTLAKRDVPYYRRKLGIVFQDFRLIPKMTVYDNVAFAMRVIGASSRDVRKKVPIVLSLVGLSEKWRCYPKELSGGENSSASAWRVRLSTIRR